MIATLSQPPRLPSKTTQEPFMMVIGAHKWNLVKILFALTFVLMNPQSGHKFAHVTAAEAAKIMT